MVYVHTVIFKVKLAIIKTRVLFTFQLIILAHFVLPYPTQTWNAYATGDSLKINKTVKMTEKVLFHELK